MHWLKYTVVTTVEAEDVVSSLLAELGAEGVEIEDNLPPTGEELGRMFIPQEPELQPELPQADGSSRVSFYLHPAEPEEIRFMAESEQAKASADDSYVIHDRLWTPQEVAELLEQLRQELEEYRSFLDIGEGRIEESFSDEKDWRDEWKKYFRPMVLDGILIKPVWEQVPENCQAALDSGQLKLLEMEPGTAFGSGTHASTRLCMDGLSRFLKPGDRVLDIGTGSGILALSALLLGAEKAGATELDPACEGVVTANRKRNGFSEDRLKLWMGNLLGDEEIRRQAEAFCPDGYDLVLANILAPVIVQLAAPGEADRFTRPGGILAGSGIIDLRIGEVEDAFRANPAWEILEVTREGEWCGIICRRR